MLLRTKTAGLVSTWEAGRGGSSCGGSWQTEKSASCGTSCLLPHAWTLCTFSLQPRRRVTCSPRSAWFPASPSTAPQPHSMGQERSLTAAASEYTKVPRPRWISGENIFRAESQPLTKLRLPGSPAIGYRQVCCSPPTAFSVLLLGNGHRCAVSGSIRDRHSVVHAWPASDATGRAGPLTGRQGGASAGCDL